MMPDREVEIGYTVVGSDDYGIIMLVLQVERMLYRYTSWPAGTPHLVPRADRGARGSDIHKSIISRHESDMSLSHGSMKSLR